MRRGENWPSAQKELQCLMAGSSCKKQCGLTVRVQRLHFLVPQFPHLLKGTTALSSQGRQEE